MCIRKPDASDRRKRFCRMREACGACFTSISNRELYVRIFYNNSDIITMNIRMHIRKCTLEI